MACLDFCFADCFFSFSLSLSVSFAPATEAFYALHVTVLHSLSAGIFQMIVFRL